MQNFCYAWRRYQFWWRFFLVFVIGSAIAISISWANIDRIEANALPEAARHPMPTALEQWRTDSSVNSQDYFDTIQVSPVGHLIWSAFPVHVFYPEPDLNASPNQQQQQFKWQTAVEAAIAEWSAYIPLSRTETSDTADIIVLREAPPLQVSIDPDTGEKRYSFGRNAETRYRFYIDEQRYLRHQMTIHLSPHQRAIATKNTARNELGHALGIWGHSNNLEDALYVQQTSLDTGISDSDINTLKRIYQQPTQLGWPMP